MTIQMTSFGMSHTGKHRLQNEDQYLIASEYHRDSGMFNRKGVRIPPMPSQDPLLLAVSDGMGGHRGGSVAANMAVTSLSEASQAMLHQAAMGLNPIAEMKRIISEAHQNILDAGEANANLYHMGATLTAAVVHTQHVWIAHVGDSRAYLLHNGHLQRLTRDHTLAELVGNADGAGSNILWNCLGGRQAQDVEIDCLELTLEPNDRLLLCTDGLTSEVQGTAISNVLESYQSAEAAQILVDLANEHGGHDNITVIVCQASDSSELVEKPRQSTRKFRYCQLT